MYVWIDALFNYASALGGIRSADFKKYWSETYHVVGKEILRFHAVYWPAFLIGTKYKKGETISLNDIEKDSVLPKQVYAHGFWDSEGRKMSKSFGNVITADEEIQRLITEYKIEKEVAVDYLRYYLMNEMPFGNDGDYSKERMEQKINSELVNNIGNLSQRTLSMVFKNCKESSLELSKTQNPFINIFIVRMEDIFNEKSDKYILGKIDGFNFNEYCNGIVEIGNIANALIEEAKPWDIWKQERFDEYNSLMYLLLNTIKRLAILLQPICPYLSMRLLQTLKIDKEYGVDLNKMFAKGDGLEFDKLKDDVISKSNIDKPEIIFPRLNKIQ